MFKIKLEELEMDEIFKRVSIRKYQDTKVEDEKIMQVLRAAMAAPSARNDQPWEFYVIKNKKMIEELSLTSPYTKFVAGAPLAIVPCHRNIEGRYEYNLIDLSNATENLLLEISSLGLGACWCAVEPKKDRVEHVRKTINIPENLTPFALVSVGYPAEEKKQQDRFDKDRIHIVE